MGLRIFSGTLKGIPLQSLKGAAIRPTSGRVREALFNILSLRIRSAAVLDLFAGSGALGIEALSRGARMAVFIDEAPEAVALLHGNITRCGLEERATVLRWDICRNLHCLSGFSGIFDLVFIDPPYRREAVAPTLAHLRQSGSCRKDALFVVEHGFKEKLELPAGFQITDQRKYGKTLVSFLEDVL